MPSICKLVLCCLVFSLASVPLLEASGKAGLAVRHIRSKDHRLLAATTEGLQRSPLFRSLVARIEQALISGVFTLAKQAIQLGFIPRVRVIYTHALHRGLEVEDTGPGVTPDVMWAANDIGRYDASVQASQQAIERSYGDPKCRN